MKCFLGISDFLEEIANLSHSVVFLCLFALIAEEGFLISPCYFWNSAFRCLYLSFSPLLFTSLLFTAICKGRWPGGSTPHLRSGAVAERSNPMSKEWWLPGCRRDERSCSTFKVRRGRGEKIPLVQGKGLCWSSREEIPHVPGKRNPSKMVDIARGHQRADTLKT